MNAATRRRVRRRAGRRCEYCRIHEDNEPYAFHLEHTIPKKHGGTDSVANLAWSCQYCNLGKGSNVAGIVSGKVDPLFNPRRQKWNRHFRWKGAVLVGRTKCGKASVKVLRINDADRVWLRRLLMMGGDFPPD